MNTSTAMRAFRRFLVLMTLLPLMPCRAPAQVPQLINFQGRVSVGTMNFQGTGQFRFALVNGTGSTTYWSNDGTSLAGAQPSAAVTLPVSKGLYTVALGETSLPNMTAIPHTVFQHDDVRLRVWFDDGVHGVQQLTPDQRISAVGYAMMAANVPDGSITSSKIAGGAIGGTHLAPGAVEAALAASGLTAVPSGGVIMASEQDAAAMAAAGFEQTGTTTLPDGWRARLTGAAPDPRTGHSMVWTGAEFIIWGGVLNGVYLNEGARYHPATKRWTPIGTHVNFNARAYHTACWTGTEMVLWGGYDGIYLGDGARYNPVTNQWTYFNNNINAPAGRTEHGMVWTGSDLIVWGGKNASGRLGNGAKFNFAANSWSPLPAGPPVLEAFSTVWTGTEMILYGGLSNGYSTTGYRFHATTGQWKPVPSSTTAGIPGRTRHSAVWTGSKMIVWGGTNADGYLNGGGLFDPVSETWTALPAIPALLPRHSHTAVWTGTEMIVWGGEGDYGYFSDGARFHPGSTAWATLPTQGKPASRRSHTAVWTGTEMMLWGGAAAHGPSDHGAVFNPAENAWKPMQYGHPGGSSVWTGNELITWGLGRIGSSSSYYTRGGKFDPDTGMWSPISIAGDPEPRYGYTMVWTGTEMIVWGGISPVTSTALATGGRYQPDTDTWTSTAIPGAPAGRQGHSAVWTGAEMIVWGGGPPQPNNSAMILETNTGSRYHPATNTWSALPSAGAPSARGGHTAVWTGTEMIVCGGWLDALGNIADPGVYPVDCARYRPATNSWIAMPNGFHGAGHAAGWLGDRMIVWGGRTGYMENPATPEYDSMPILEKWTYFYDPAANQWSPPAELPFSPPPGTPAFAAAAGDQFIVWKDNAGSRYTKDHGWIEMDTKGAPPNLEFASAHGAGSRILVLAGDKVYSYTPGQEMTVYQKP